MVELKDIPHQRNRTVISQRTNAITPSGRLFGYHVLGERQGPKYPKLVSGSPLEENDLPFYVGDGVIVESDKTLVEREYENLVVASYRFFDDADRCLLEVGQRIVLLQPQEARKNIRDIYSKDIKVEIEGEEVSLALQAILHGTGGLTKIDLEKEIAGRISNINQGNGFYFVHADPI